MSFRRLLPMLGGPLGQRLVAPGLLRGLTLTRAQAGGAVATADIDVSYTLIANGALSAPLALTRAQASGALATGDVV